jgi:hypothetical protein
MTHSIARISNILGYKNAHVFDEQPRVNQWRFIERLRRRETAEKITAENEQPVRDAIQ